MKVRVQLSFVIEGDWRTIPDVTRIADFIEGGLQATGVVTENKSCELLPGSRMKVGVVGGIRAARAPR